VLGCLGGGDAGAQAPAAAPPPQGDPRESCTQTKDRELAVRTCSELIARDPNDAALYNARGIAYAELKQHDRAIADYSEAIRLSPHDPVLYANRGMSYNDKREYDRAIADLSEAIRLGPHASDYIDRCYAYKAKGDYGRAVADCNEAIRLDPDNVIAYLRRGQTWEAKGERQMAIADYEKALSLPAPTQQLRDEQADARRRLAALRAVVSTPPKMTAPAPKAPEPAPKAPEPAPKATLPDVGDAGAKALADLNEAIRRDPTSAIAYVRRGQLWEAKGERQKAIDDYVMALALPAPTKQARDEQDEASRRYAALRASLAPPAPKVTTVPAPKTTAPGPKVSSEAKPPTSSAPPGAQLGRRVALAIGNGTYRKVDPLPNPRKDASDIGAALKAAGFAEVSVLHDLGLREMQRALAAFEAKAADADWALVYYGGHAIQVDGKNYLIPVDAELKSASDVEDETLVLDRVLARIGAGGKLRLVILDACRTNPWRRIWGGAKSREVAERGLVRYETTPRNVVIAYAAAAGQVAVDGPPGGNSPYVKALLKHLAMPGLELGKLFRLVGDDVMAETGGKQQPFEYGSRSGEDLFFRAASK
jgi:tetratricopeptide (TPR) repeat protein